MDTSKFLSGSDYPFIHEIVIKEIIYGIGNYDGLNNEEYIAIEQKTLSQFFLD